MRTHPVDKLLEQHCYKSAAGLLQLMRFYVYRIRTNRISRKRKSLENKNGVPMTILCSARQFFRGDLRRLYNSHKNNISCRGLILSELR